jgi:hypothetical protein
MQDAGSVFTDDELGLLCLCAVGGRQSAICKLEQMALTGVSADFCAMHTSLVQKLKHMSDADYAAIDFVGYLDRCVRDGD